MSPAAASPRQSPSVKNALERLGELVSSGELASWLAVDAKSGEPTHPEARTLFTTLPALGPNTTADDVTELGLWPAVPGGLKRALDVPRYRPGRDLFVKAPVTHEATDRHRPVGTHDTSRPPAFTHLAELRGKAGDHLVVAVAGATTPLRFARTDVFEWNEPTPVPAAGALSGVQIDYNDP